MILGSLALAASPGGFRVGPVVSTNMIALRTAVVVGPETGTLVQGTLQGQVSYRSLQVRVAMPVVYAQADEGAAVNLGVLRVGAGHAWSHGDAWFHVGGEVAAPVTGPALWADSWATVAAETVAATEVVAVFEAAFLPRRPVTARIALGWRSDAYADRVFYFPLPAAQVVVAGVPAAIGPLALVVEGEAIADYTPLSARLLLRLDAGPHLSFDLGGQLPILEVIREPLSAQALAQARGFF